MTELNIDYNMRLELTNSFEQDLKLSTYKHTGIKNIGNTCYMNAVLQSLIHCGLFDN